ncbi:MAG: type II toxin-antitoxin system RelE/ParE family toxin [Solirubrobacterales bacterium]|nr:type II toxin-antitoxin system RelE/ParE family toxin [Solirubrobacterales bacterium]
MPRYEIALAPAAARALRKLDPPVARRVARRLDRLRHDPRPADARLLHGDPPGLLRIRTGDWRVVYRVDDGRVTVLVVAIGHRSRIYRR